MAESIKKVEVPEAKKEAAPIAAKPRPARPEPPKLRAQWAPKAASEAPPRPANRFEAQPQQPSPYILTPDTRHVDAYWRSRYQKIGTTAADEQAAASRRYANPAFEPRYHNDEYDVFDDIYQDDEPQIVPKRREKRSLSRHGRTGRDLAIAAGLALSLSTVAGAAVYDRASGGTIAAAIMAPFAADSDPQTLAELPKATVSTEEATPVVAAVAETPPAPDPISVAPAAETPQAVEQPSDIKPIATAKLEVADATGPADSPVDLDLKAIPGQAGQDLELRLSGVPEDAYLTAGTKISPASWSLKPAEAAIVKLVMPSKRSGEFDLAVAAVEAKTGELVAPMQEITVKVDSPTTQPAPAAQAEPLAQAEPIAVAPPEEPVAETPAPATSEKMNDQVAEEPTIPEPPGPTVETLNNEPVERAAVPPPQVTAALDPQAGTAAEPKAVPVEALPAPVAAIDPAKPAQPAVNTGQADEQARTLISRGDHLMTLGDLAAARDFYMEALKLGAAPTTLLQVGMTYDPVIYAANKVAGLSPDKQLALEYYRQADKAGVTAARDAIARLEAWTQN